MNEDIEILRRPAPLDLETAWEVESLLLKIFEYGDYSFRSALRGDYSETLDCTFFPARQRGQLVGAAGCLTGRLNPAVSLLGPVAVDTEHRGNNIGSMLVKSVIDKMKSQDCKAIYLATTDQDGVAKFYEKLGFQKHCGIVMRHLFCNEADFNNSFNTAETQIRRAVWGDFPAICILATIPAGFYTFDLPRDIFSSKYVEPRRFLSIFPRMMKEYAKQGGFANVLVASHNQAVVGLAGVTRLSTQAQRHVAELDFFVHDNFLNQVERLVRATVEQTNAMDIQDVTCYCLKCDHLKRNIIENIGGKQIAVLPENVLINDNYDDILVYQLGDDNYAKD
jgi:N-acetylglutamate synthase-like GNAT family acetyltransferase